MQARGRSGRQQFQNDTATVNGQKEFLADAAAELSVEAKTQIQNKTLQRK